MPVDSGGGVHSVGVWGRRKYHGKIGDCEQSKGKGILTKKKRNVLCESNFFSET